MKRIFTGMFVGLLIIGFTDLVCQTVKPALPLTPETSFSTPPQSSVKPALKGVASTTSDKKIPVASKGTVLNPEPIVYGNSTIPGDSEVIAILSDIKNMYVEYNKELEILNNKYKTPWALEQEKFKNAIDKVKLANKWGDEVTFNIDTRQWIKLDVQKQKNLTK
jgi:hypothetical protein